LVHSSTSEDFRKEYLANTPGPEKLNRAFSF
jgi:hypothetical protein